MTTDMLFLFFGFTVVWIGIFGYLLYVRSQISRLHDDVHNLRNMSESPETEHGPGNR